MIFTPAMFMQGEVGALPIKVEEHKLRLDKQAIDCNLSLLWHSARFLQTWPLRKEGLFYLDWMEALLAQRTKVMCQQNYNYLSQNALLHHIDSDGQFTCTLAVELA